MVESNQVVLETNNIDNMYGLFHFISNEGEKKFHSLYILNYLYNFIVSDEVAKRKTSARVFEDLLAILLNGQLTDTQSRKNSASDVPDYFGFSKDKIAGNKREKIDILFNNSYGVSVKTLIKSNKEINLGSFEKKILFDGLDILESLTERKSDKNGMGLGSKSQLRKLFEHLQKNNKYDEFRERFVKMFDFIFADDIILAIKDSTKLELYFIKGSEFTKLIEENSYDIENLLTILNRWEGNSIRIDRERLITSTSRKIVLDFSVLDTNIMKQVNDFDELLHINYIKYFHENDNKNIKDEVFTNLTALFENFDKNYGDLS
ncbi:MAG: hypothetical protein Q9M36_12515 [Sulfurovum sp.]|nr:hypothetical protein [Sulfurovum sp.]